MKTRVKQSDGFELYTICRQLFSQLGEAATTEITRVESPRGFEENKKTSYREVELQALPVKDLKKRLENQLFPQKTTKALNSGRI